MVKRCSWGTCNSDTRYPERLANGVSFIPFPKPRKSYEQCLRWIRLCGRPHQQLNETILGDRSKNKHFYVCTKHFKEGRPTKAFPDPEPAIDKRTPVRPPPEHRRASEAPVKKRRKVLAETVSAFSHSFSTGWCSGCRASLSEATAGPNTADHALATRPWTEADTHSCDLQHVNQMANSEKGLMAPSEGFYQLIFTTNEQDVAIKSLFRERGWTLHSKAVNEDNIHSYLENDNENASSVIQSTVNDVDKCKDEQEEMELDNPFSTNSVQDSCTECGIGDISEKEARSGEESIEHVNNEINTLDFVVVKNELIEESEAPEIEQDEEKNELIEEPDSLEVERVEVKKELIEESDAPEIGQDEEKNELLEESETLEIGRVEVKKELIEETDALEVERVEVKNELTEESDALGIEQSGHSDAPFKFIETNFQGIKVEPDEIDPQVSSADTRSLDTDSEILSGAEDDSGTDTISDHMDTSAELLSESIYNDSEATLSGAGDDSSTDSVSEEESVETQEKEGQLQRNIGQIIDHCIVSNVTAKEDVTVSSARPDACQNVHINHSVPRSRPAVIPNAQAAGLYPHSESVPSHMAGSQASQSAVPAKIKTLYDQFVQVTNLFHSTISHLSREEQLRLTSAAMPALNIQQGGTTSSNASQFTSSEAFARNNPASASILGAVRASILGTAISRNGLTDRPASVNTVPNASSSGSSTMPVWFPAGRAGTDRRLLGSGDVYKIYRERNLQRLADGVKREFQCPTCLCFYVSRRTLRSHIYHHHPGITPPHDCVVCLEVFRSQEELLAHRQEKKHHARHKKRYHCEQCGVYLARPESLKLHNKYPHTAKDQFPCEVCGKVLSTATKANAHRKHAHVTEECSCDVCGKVFDKLRSMESHKKRHNVSNKRYMCDQCGKAFFNKGALRTHMTIHTGIKPFKCKFCDYASGIKANTAKHMRIHNKARVEKTEAEAVGGDNSSED